MLLLRLLLVYADALVPFSLRIPTSLALLPLSLPSPSSLPPAQRLHHLTPPLSRAPDVDILAGVTNTSAIPLVLGGETEMCA